MITLFSVLAQAEPQIAAGGGILMLLIFGVGLLIALATFALWLWALINAIQNPNLDSNTKLIWILVILLTAPIGPLLYLFIGRK